MISVFCNPLFFSLKMGDRDWEINTILFIFLITACSPTIPTLEYNPKGEYALEKYIYSVDLNEVENDRVYVHLHCPGLNQDTVIFHFPKTIPGTYKELDYGEMIPGIEPRDSNGELVPVEKIGKNIFQITISHVNIE